MLFSLRSVLRDADAGDAGGSPASTPATTPATIEQPKGKPQDKATRTAGELKAYFEKARAAKPDVVTPPANDNAVEAAPTDKAAKTAEALDDAGAKVPEQKEGESDKKYEIRLAKALQDVRELEAAAKREKAGREASDKKAELSEKKLAEFERRILRAKDPETLLEALEELTGHTYESITRGIVEKKIRAGSKSATIPPELRKQMEEQAAELDRLKKVEDERTTQQKQAAQRQAFESHTKQAKDYLDQNAEDFPLLAASGWAAADLVRAAYAKNTGDLGVLAREMEENVYASVSALINSDKGLKKLAKDPAVKAKIMEALGATVAAKPPAAEAKREPARAASRVSSEATTPAPRPTSKDELRQAAKDGLRKLKMQK